MGGKMAAIPTATIKYNVASINLNDNLSSSSSTASISSSPSLLSLTSRKSQSPSKIRSLHNGVVLHSNNISSTILNNNIPAVSSTSPNKIIPPLIPKKKKILDGFVILESSGKSLPDDVLIISLSSRDFVQVAEDDLAYFTELQYLDVSENQLSLSSFQHLANLKVLKISSNSTNHLSQIHITTSFRSSSSSRLRNRSRPTSSSGTNYNNNCNSRDNIVKPVTPTILYNNSNCFPNLIVLDISYNALTYRDMLILGYLPQLKELDISGNDLNVLYRNNNNSSSAKNHNSNNNNNNNNSNNNNTIPFSPPSSSSLIRLRNDELIPETDTMVVDKANKNIDSPNMATAAESMNSSNSYAGYDDFDDDYYDDEEEEEEEEKNNDGGGRHFINHNGNNNYFNSKQPSQQQQRSRPNTTSNRVPNLRMDGLFLNLEQIVLDYNGLDNAMIFVELGKLPNLIHISAAHNFLSTLPSGLIALPSSSTSSSPGQDLEDKGTTTAATTNTGTSTVFTSLRSIDLSFNYFRSPETFKPFIHTTRLTTLILYGNPCLGPSGEDSLHSYVEDLEVYYKENKLNKMRKDILIITEIPRVRVKKGQPMGRQAYYDNFNIQEVKILPLENKLTYVWRAEGNKILFGEAVQEAKLFIHGAADVIEVKEEEAVVEPVDDYTGAVVFITQNDEDQNTAATNDDDDSEKNK